MNVATRTIRILILHDASGGSDLAECVLRRAGLVFTARNVDTLTAFSGALADFNPDIVLADIGCAGGNGSTVTGMTRRHSPHTPVILLTGELDEDAALELLDAGAADYVSRDRLERLGFAARKALADAKERRSLHRALTRTSRASKTITRCNEALVRAESEPQLLDDMCGVLVEAGGYRMAWVGLATPDENWNVQPVARHGHDEGYVERVNGPCGRPGIGPTCIAITTGEPKVVQNMAAVPEYTPWRDEALKRGYAACVALPLKTDGTILGALTIYAAEPDAFAAEELWLLTHLADALSYGMAALRGRCERDTAMRLLHDSLETAASAPDGTGISFAPPSAGHPQNVAVLAVAIARELNLPEDQVQGIFLAGLIHDAGRNNIPFEFLGKTGKLTPLEFNILQAHVQAGYGILKDVEFPWPIAETIQQHHERLNGSGYPNGLMGDEILIEARILAVADVVDGMITHHPQRAALGLNAALSEIEKNGGRFYDPAAADACISLFTKKGFELS